MTMAKAVSLPGQQLHSIYSYLYIYEPQTGIQQHNVTQKVNFIRSKNWQVMRRTDGEKDGKS